MHLESRVIDVSNFTSSKSTTSKGNQQKWSDGKTWVKGPFEYDGRYWQDYWVEVIAADIGQQLSFNVVQQGPALIRLEGKQDRVGCWSKNFLPVGYSFLAVDRLVRAHKAEKSFYRKVELSAPDVIFSTVREIIRNLTGLDTKRYLTEMVVLDFFIGNEDRHYNNFGVLWNAETNCYMPAPLFDNGLGLFEHDSKYYNLTLEEAISKMHGKPFSPSLKKAVSSIDISSLHVKDKVIDISGLTFPNELAKPYLLQAASYLGIEVV